MSLTQTQAGKEADSLPQAAQDARKVQKPVDDPDAEQRQYDGADRQESHRRAELSARSGVHGSVRGSSWSSSVELCEGRHQELVYSVEKCRRCARGRRWRNQGGATSEHLQAQIGITTAHTSSHNFGNWYRTDGVLVQQ